MACADLKIKVLPLLGMLAMGCSFAADGVKDPMVLEADAGEESPPDAGPPAVPQGMADAGTAEDAVAPDDLSAPDYPPLSGPPGWVGGQLVVAVGQGGRRVLSPDGTDWTGDLRDAPGGRDPTKDLVAISYAAGLVVAVGGGCTGSVCAGRIVTFDGARWSEVALPPNRGWLGAVAYGNGVWVAAGAAGAALVSSDGKSWTARGSLPAAVRALAWGSLGGTPAFIAVGDDGLRARSVDGQAWTGVARGFPGSDGPVSLRSVAIGDGAVVAAGALGRRIRSSNGLDWSDPAAGGSDLASVVFADRTFLAYADNGIVFLSGDDGRTWNPQVLVDPPRHSVATGMMAGSRLFVAARGEIIMTSSNGLAWSTRPGSTVDANTLNAFVFAGY
jgi:hypothetical protein